MRRFRIRLIRLSIRYNIQRSSENSSDLCEFSSDWGSDPVHFREDGIGEDIILATVFEAVEVVVEWSCVGVLEEL